MILVSTREGTRRIPARKPCWRVSLRTAGLCTAFFPDMAWADMAALSYPALVRARAGGFFDDMPGLAGLCDDA